MSCGTELAWYDNVPVLSWLLLRGRCRSCYVEISAALPGGRAGHRACSSPAASRVRADAARPFVGSFFCVVLVAISATDLTHRIVPNRIVLPAAVIVLVAQTVLEPSPEWPLGALGASVFLLVAALAYPAGMGMGDVKLALLLGAMLGRLVRRRA